MIPTLTLRCVMHSVVTGFSHKPNLLLALLLLICPALFAQPRQVLKSVTVDGNYPYNFVRDKQVQGVVVDVVKELASRLNLEFSVELVPWTRALYRAKTEEKLMAFSVARIPEREDHYHWIGPVASNEEWLFKLKSRTDIRLHTVKDANRYLVGDVAGSAGLPTFAKFGIKVDTAPSMLSNCKKLKLGRIDLVPFDPEGISSFAAHCQIPIENLEKTVRLPLENSLYLVLGKSTPLDFIQQLEKEFAIMVKDQSMSRIQKRWKADLTTKKE